MLFSFEPGAGVLGSICILIHAVTLLLVVFKETRVRAAAIPGVESEPVHGHVLPFADELLAAFVPFVVAKAADLVGLPEAIVRSVIPFLAPKSIFLAA